MVGCRSSCLNQSKPSPGPVLTLMSSSVEVDSFSLRIYINCAIKSLYLFRQCDVNNLVNCAIKSLYVFHQCDIINLVNCAIKSFCVFRHFCAQNSNLDFNSCFKFKFCVHKCVYSKDVL